LVLVLVAEGRRELEGETLGQVPVAEEEAVSEAVSDAVADAVLEAERLLVLLDVLVEEALAGLLLDAVLLLEGVLVPVGTLLEEGDAEGKLQFSVGITVGEQTSES
jgi:hypothetical protein